LRRFDGEATLPVSLLPRSSNALASMGDQANRELLELFRQQDGTPRLDLQRRLAENKEIASAARACEFENEFFKITELQPGYFGAVAKVAIPQLTVILVESPLLDDMSRFGFAYDEEFRAQPDAQRLWAVIQRGSQRHSMKTGADQYPPDVAAAMDSLMDLYASRRIAPGLDRKVKARIMALQDSFRKPIVGAVAIIEGLKSSAGQALNGLDGVVVSREDGDRFGVKVEGIEDSKSIRANNLKTLGGIMRTNMFEEGLYEVLSRFNHACSEARNLKKNEVVGIDPQAPKQTHSLLFATKSIDAGQELFVDYTPEESQSLGVAARRKNLQLKFGFTCECAKCQAEPG